MLPVAMQIETGFGPDLSLADPTLQFGLHPGIEMRVAHRRRLGREVWRHFGILILWTRHEFTALAMLIDINAIVTQSLDARNQAVKIGIIIVVHGVITDQMPIFTNIIRKCSQTYIQIG